MRERVAFLFPGQGRVPERLPEPTRQLSALLRQTEEAGLALETWISERREDRLAQTDAAQPALFVESLSRAQSLAQAGWTADCVAGHSLGEYAALVHSRVLTAYDAMHIVIERGRHMREVSGAMAAVLGLDWDAVCSLCHGVDAVAANHNTPKQVVVSGTFTAVQAVLKRAEAQGGRVIPLDVSGPFHSPQMRDAQRSLSQLLQRVRFSPPAIPFVSSVVGDLLAEPDDLREVMLRQMTSPVRWVDVTRSLSRIGVTLAVEVGGGRVLTELGRRSQTPIRFLTYEEALDEQI
jgi:[acyl-carrier-protein] S-malonyltransferase